MFLCCIVFVVLHAIVSGEEEEIALLQTHNVMRMIRSSNSKVGSRVAEEASVVAPGDGSIWDSHGDEGPQGSKITIAGMETFAMSTSNLYQLKWTFGFSCWPVSPGLSGGVVEQYTVKGNGWGSFPCLKEGEKGEAWGTADETLCTRPYGILCPEAELFQDQSFSINYNRIAPNWMECRLTAEGKQACYLRLNCKVDSLMAAAGWYYSEQSLSAINMVRGISKYVPKEGRGEYGFKSEGEDKFFDPDKVKANEPFKVEKEFEKIEVVGA